MEPKNESTVSLPQGLSYDSTASCHVAGPPVPNLNQRFVEIIKLGSSSTYQSQFLR